MVRLSRLAFFALLPLMSCSGTTAQEDSNAATPPKPPAAYYTAQAQPPVMMQAEGIPWPHEIRVSLPIGYDASPEATFPVLWVTDGGLYHGTASEMAAVNATLGFMPNVIIVSVGHPTNESRATFSSKRQLDFLFPDFDLLETANAEDPAAKAYLDSISAQPAAAAYMEANANGAKFLDFLIDVVRPKLSETYRMSDHHTLFGHSGGGMFTSRAIFERPGAFDGYIISSGTTQDAFMAEIDYAKENTDLDAKVFIAAGDLEVTNAQYAPMRLVSSTLKLAESLALRGYPSLELEVRVFQGKNHATVTPLSLGEGMLWIYEDQLEE